MHLTSTCRVQAANRAEWELAAAASKGKGKGQKDESPPLPLQPFTQGLRWVTELLTIDLRKGPPPVWYWVVQLDEAGFGLGEFVVLAFRDSGTFESILSQSVADCWCLCPYTAVT